MANLKEGGKWPLLNWSFLFSCDVSKLVINFQTFCNLLCVSINTTWGSSSFLCTSFNCFILLKTASELCFQIFFFVFGVPFRNTSCIINFPIYKKKIKLAVCYTLFSTLPSFIFIFIFYRIFSGNFCFQSVIQGVFWKDYAKCFSSVLAKVNKQNV